MPKIQLISAPADKGKVPLYEEGAFVPLGLIWLANYLKQHNHKAEIIDGQHVSLEDIKEKLSAPIIGISFNILSTDSFDEIIEHAKNISSTVVVGGQAATPLVKELLKNPKIDYVVRYDGEEALRLLCEGAEPKTIPNLSYRHKKSIIHNPVQLIDLSSLKTIDWNLKGIELKKYWDRFKLIKKAVQHRHYHNRPISSFNKKGCPRRQNNKGCSFCSRADRELRNKTPQQVYDEFMYLAQLGADRIEEFSDSWLYNKKWLRELANIIEKKGHWGIPVRVYADTRDFNQEVIELMKIIRIDSVVLGVESGNEEILRKNYKPNSVKQILHCAELLGKAGIRASPSYILGLIGETKETIEDTFKIADEIKKRCNIEMSYFSIMTPFPGSKAWNLLLQDPKMRKKYSGKYKFNVVELQKDFIERFTGLGKDGFEYLSKKIEEKIKADKIAERDY